MKRIVYIITLTLCALTMSAQVKSDAEITTYNNTYIRAGLEQGIRASNHNMINRYFIASKIHKDSLANIRVIGDTTLIYTYKGVTDTVAINRIEELNDLSDVNLTSPDASDILILDDETMKWINYPFSNLIGDINDSLPNYWYLDEDTVKTLYHVRVDSSFLMNYKNYQFGYGDYFGTPGGVINYFDNDTSISFEIYGELKGTQWIYNKGESKIAYILIEPKDGNTPYLCLTSQDNDTTSQISIYHDNSLIYSADDAGASTIQISPENIILQSLTLYDTSSIIISPALLNFSGDIYIDTIPTLPATSLIGWNSATGQLVASDTSLVTELDGLSDVVLTTPDASDMLILDDETMKWINYPFSNLIGDINDSLPNYWYLDNDTAKTNYNVAVDSSFIVDYKGCLFEIGSILKIPYDSLISLMAGNQLDKFSGIQLIIDNGIPISTIGAGDEWGVNSSISIYPDSIIIESDSIVIDGNASITGYLKSGTGSIADNDSTPSVASYNTFIYAGSANPVSIDALDDHVVGCYYTIIGNSNTYTITVIDGTPSGGDSFNLAGGNWVGGSQDVLVLYCIAADAFIEVSRSDN